MPLTHKNKHVSTISKHLSVNKEGLGRTENQMCFILVYTAPQDVVRTEYLRHYPQLGLHSQPGNWLHSN